MTFKKLSILRAILAGVFLCSGSAFSNNLLSNGDLESGETGWNLEVMDGEAVADWSSSDAAQSGSQGVKIDVTTLPSENWKIQVNVPRGVAMQKDVAYEFSFYAKADGDQSIHIAKQGGAPNYDYMEGVDAVLNSNWKKVTATFTAPATGTEAFVVNVYLGGSTGTYYLDNFSLKATSNELPSTLSAPASGAIATGTYRNLFLELGKTQEEIDEKVEDVFNQYFTSTSEQLRLFYPVGADMGYIKAIDSDDIRSEGMSYGMMICVQLGKKDFFDKLWNFAYTHTRHESGPREGAFAWQVVDNGDGTFTKKDDNSAPDGEEYFAMALLFAENRWGNGTGIYNYGQQARDLLHKLIHLEEDNGGVVDGLVNFFDNDEKKVVFVPEGNNADYTDPSYHLPSFYRLWAQTMPQDSAFWEAAADTSEAFFARAMHPTTGLVTEYMTFEGQPKTTSFNSNSHKFAYDSFRVGMNIGMDAHWFGASYQPELMERLLDFFASQEAGYLSVYTQDGIPESTNNHPSEALVAMNAVAVLGSNDPAHWQFVADFWNSSAPTGEWRYYKGMLYMLGLLQASGKYRAIGYDGLEPVDLLSYGVNFQTQSKSRLIFDGSTILIQRVDKGKIVYFDLNGQKAN